MHAIILAVGDELTLGQTIDTNSAWLSQQLATIGLPVRAHVTVPDDQTAIEQAVRDAAGLTDILLITGGIGPTPDDLTRQALAAVMDQPLELNEKWLTELHTFFSKRNRPMPEMNKVQAMIPRGAELIWNHNGTAAGIHAHLQGTTDHGPRTTDIYVMPGVPKEMKLMFERSILPTLREKSSGAVILSKTLHTFGQGESTVAEMLGDLMDRTRNPSVGTTVSAGIVSVRINARFPNKDEARHHLDATVADCYAKLADLIFAEDDTTLPESVAKLLLAHPVAKQWAPAVCTAESCTGGLLAKYLTDVPGSSAYFRQGWVTYDNEAKQNELNVTSQTLERHGAVSEPTVREMVLGAALRSGAPYALAISGIAGPAGGSPSKPVGTVCIALHTPGHTSLDPTTPYAVQARTFLFPGDREMIRDRSAKMALTLLRFHLLNKPLPF
jgi:nicotinamide-nucleotide amidase